MNDEQFEGRMQIVEVEVSQLMANQLRARDKAQCEAIERLQGELDEYISTVPGIEYERDNLRAALARVAELKSAYITMTNQSILVNGEHCYYLKSSEMAAFDRIFTNAQAEQQEARPQDWMPSWWDEMSAAFKARRDAQGAQAGDDEWERFVQFLLSETPAEHREHTKSAINQDRKLGMFNEYRRGAWDAWQARAALATQPAKWVDPVCPTTSGPVYEQGFADGVAQAWRLNYVPTVRGAEHDQ